MREKKLSSSLFPPTLIVGAGRVGLSLAFALKKSGVPLLAATSRNPQKRAICRKFKLPTSKEYLPFVPYARLIFLAVNDDAITSVV
jgi:predicted dinucleotide-binding enzyme